MHAIRDDGLYPSIVCGCVYVCVDVCLCVPTPVRCSNNKGKNKIFRGCDGYVVVALFSYKESDIQSDRAEAGCATLDAGPSLAHVIQLACAICVWLTLSGWGWRA